MWKKPCRDHRDLQTSNRTSYSSAPPRWLHEPWGAAYRVLWDSLRHRVWLPTLKTTPTKDDAMRMDNNQELVRIIFYKLYLVIWKAPHAIALTNISVQLGTTNFIQQTSDLGYSSEAANRWCTTPRSHDLTNPTQLSPLSTRAPEMTGTQVSLTTWVVTQKIILRTFVIIHPQDYGITWNVVFQTPYLHGLDSWMPQQFWNSKVTLEKEHHLQGCKSFKEKLDVGRT